MLKFITFNPLTVVNGIFKFVPEVIDIERNGFYAGVDSLMRDESNHSILVQFDTFVLVVYVL